MNQSKNPYVHQPYSNTTTYILSAQLTAFTLKILLKDKSFYRCHKKYFPSVMDGKFRLRRFSIGKKKIAYHETNFREAEKASFDRWLLGDLAEGVSFRQIRSQIQNRVCRPRTDSEKKIPIIPFPLNFS